VVWPDFGGSLEWPGMIGFQSLDRSSLPLASADRLQ
jgi:hypothetical protein